LNPSILVVFFIEPHDHHNEIFWVLHHVALSDHIDIFYFLIIFEAFAYQAISRGIFNLLNKDIIQSCLHRGVSRRDPNVKEVIEKSHVFFFALSATKYINSYTSEVLFDYCYFILILSSHKYIFLVLILEAILHGPFFGVFSNKISVSIDIFLNQLLIHSLQHESQEFMSISLLVAHEPLCKLIDCVL